MEEFSKVFVDSNYFIGLFNPEDSLYQKANEIGSRLDRIAKRLVVSNFIFLETVTVLSQKRGRSAALEAGDYLLNSPVVELINIDHKLQQDTWQIFQDINKKNLSFVDSSIIAVMQAESINALLTFDTKDFASLRRKYKFHFDT